MSKILLLGGNGYIGSSVYKDLSKDNEVYSFDLLLFGKDLGYSYKEDYRKIQTLRNIDYVVLLSNHSSVQMAAFDPDQAWSNNVDGLRRIIRMLTDDQKLIYISSGSVYGNSPIENTEDSININPLNAYDLTKITMDIIANESIASGKNIVGLRLGTVNGHSQNLRGDLMVNMMVKSALEEGKINLSNGDFNRAILGMKDLVRAIRTIIDSDFVSGMYNVSSLNSTISDIAKTVAKVTDVPVIDHGLVGKTYNFQLNTDKFKNTYNFEFKETIESIVNSLVKNYDNEAFTIRKEYETYKLY